MKTANSESRTSPVLPRGVRVLAIITGFFAGFVFLPEVIPLLLALMLIVGAAIQPWTHRAGKWLLVSGAFSVTSVSSVAFIGLLRKLHGATSVNFDAIGLPLFWLVLAILIVWCDIWLIAHLMRTRHVSELQKPDYFPPVNYFVWLVAAGASAVFIPEGVRECILLYHHVLGESFGDVQLIVLPALALVVLDVALLTQGIKALHAYLSHGHSNAA